MEIAFYQAHAFDIPQRSLDFVEEELEEEIPDQDMTDEQFQSACAGMNTKQWELFSAVTRSVRKQTTLRLFVTGGVGVGKTFTFNALKNQVNRCFDKNAVNVVALTGVAARLVSASTLHTVLKLPIQNDGYSISNIPMLTGNYLNIMRKQWKDTCSLMTFRWCLTRCFPWSTRD